MSFALGRRLIVLAALCIMALPATATRSVAAEPVMIYAAATLTNALDAAIAAAETSLHVPVTVVYGPSPSLVKQLENGAPGDIFFSADTDWMDEAAARKIVDPATRVDLLSSKLVLIAPASQAVATPIAPGFPLAAMLGEGRLVMCDPMMMPAGRYGRLALQKLGVWDSVKDHIANAENVRAALAYVARREAPLGIVFDTDAMLDHDVKVIGTFPADSHPPIVYPIAAVARSHNPDTPRVVRFLASPVAKPIFEKYGYAVLPSGSSRLEGLSTIAAKE
ncbi:MAG: molybdate ABC transporter substrate-binding protein [Alphaproteobacteria bacterium]